MKAHTSTLLRVCLLSAGASLPVFAHADFINDSSLQLDLKNFYLDRDYSDSTSDVGSWSQGADLQFSSGYTDTTVQVGLDASVQGSETLSSDGNDGSLPTSSKTGEAVNEYSRGGATLKLKYSQTKLSIGDQRPHLPIAWDDTSRQLDTIYKGAVLESKEIEGLTLTAGRFWQAVTRNSSNSEDFYLWGSDGSERSSGMNFAGATYDFTKSLSGTYFYADLKDIYTQQYAGIQHKTDLGDGFKLKTDVRYFKNGESGENFYGKIHGSSFGSMVTLTKGGNMFALSYQNMNSNSNFPTMNGYIPQPYLVHWSSLAFVRPDEQSYGVRYGYNFKSLGLPGLNLFTRYIKGTDINYGSDKNAEESERDIYLSYAVQDGTFKGLSFDLKNINTKKSFGSDYDEYRFITTYTYKI